MVEPDGVEELHVDLRTVEGAAALIDGIGQTAPLDGRLEGVFRLVPDLVGTDPLRRAGGEVEAIPEAEGAVNEVDQVEHRVDLVFHLVGPAEDVGVVHGQPANAQHAVEGAGLLVPVVAGDLGVADGEIAVAALPRVIDRHVSGAVHRLDPVVVLLPLHLHRGEHHLRVGLQVPRPPEESLARDMRCVDEVVAASQELVLEEPAKDELDHRALGVPVNEARPHVLLDAEEVELFAEHPVIPLARLFQPPQVFLEMRLLEEAGRVDALEHRAPLVTAPVGARRVQDLEVLHPAGGGQMWPAAEVEELAVAVDGDNVSFGDLLQALELIGVVGEQLLGLGALDLAPHEAVICGHHLRHPRLDLLEVLGCEGLLNVEVVVEALGDRRAETDPGVRPQAPDRRGQHVGRRMSEDVKRVLVVVVFEEEPDRPGSLDRPGEIDDLVVQLGGDRPLGDLAVDPLRQLAGRDTVLDLYLGAVLEHQLQLSRTHFDPPVIRGKNRGARGYGPGAPATKRIVIGESGGVKSLGILVFSRTP